MTIDKFEEEFKSLFITWKESYLSNHKKEPGDWPLDIDFSDFYEDFSVWMELSGEHV